MTLPFYTGEILTADDLNKLAVKTELQDPTGGLLVGNTPAGNISTFTVQEAINELDSIKVQAADLAGAGGALLVGNNPSGTISSTTVQGAINEVSGDVIALGALTEYQSNKATDFSALNNTKYPTTQAVKDFIDSVLSGTGIVFTSSNTLTPTANGVPYQFLVTHTGGLVSVVHSITSGALPAGLIMAPDTGIIAGTPTEYGTFNFTINITDGLNSANQNASLVVNRAVDITSTVVQPGVIGTAYSQSITYVGGSTPLTWAISSGFLPTGLSLSQAGVISGTPSLAETQTFSVTVVDLYNTTDSAQLTISISASADTQTFTNSNAITINDNTAATPYPVNIVVSGMSGSISHITLNISGFTHTLPRDVDILLVAPDGVHSSIVMSDCGSVAVSGINLVFDQTATTSVPTTTIPSGTYKPTDTVLGPTDSFTSPAPAGPYTADFTAFNGINPNGTWALYIVDDAAVDTGSISAGVSLTISTGIATLGIATTSPITQGTVGSAYNFSFTASGGVGPYTWSKTAGVFPGGLTMSSAGVLSGTPTTVESQTFTVHVVDNTSASASKSITMSVVAAPVISGVLGFAEADGVTGGAGGQSIIVTNLNNSGTGSLRQAVQFTSGARIVTFTPGLTGTITLSPGGNYLYVQNDNLTIDGTGASITISGEMIDFVKDDDTTPVHNVIIKNLTFANTRPELSALMIWHGSTRVWVDHCTFINNSAGTVGDPVAVWNNSGVDGGSGVTISWCKFTTPNNKAVLIGSTEQTPGITKSTRVSIHHCWFNGTETRNPRVHGGTLCHMWNNYIYNWSEYGTGVSSNADVLVENNVYEGSGTACTPNYDPNNGAAHSVNASGNLIIGNATIGTLGTFPTAKITYSYTPDTANNTLVTNIKAGAGAS
jgi:pectate lyase/subtilisin-like proprotein convertase family protein